MGIALALSKISKNADGYLPDCVSFTGNYGSYNWYGLSFDNIQSIKKINYGTPIKY